MISFVPLLPLNHNFILFSIWIKAKMLPGIRFYAVFKDGLISKSFSNKKVPNHNHEHYPLSWIVPRGLLWYLCWRFEAKSENFSDIKLPLGTLNINSFLFTDPRPNSGKKNHKPSSLFLLFKTSEVGMWPLFALRFKTFYSCALFRFWGRNSYNSFIAFL